MFYVIIHQNFLRFQLRRFSFVLYEKKNARLDAGIHTTLQIGFKTCFWHYLNSWIQSSTPRELKVLFIVPTVLKHFILSLRTQKKVHDKNFLISFQFPKWCNIIMLFIFKAASYNISSKFLKNGSLYSVHTQFDHSFIIPQRVYWDKTIANCTTEFIGKN